MTFGKHLSGEICPFLIDIIRTVIQQVQSLDREGKNLLQALLIEPVHKTFLEPRDRLPLHFGAVREYKILKHAIEIRCVKVCTVPEDGLEIAGCCRLVERIDDLLKMVGNYLVNGALACGHIHDIIGMLVVVIAVVLTDEIVHVSDKFRRRNSASKLGCNGKAEVDELPAEGIEIMRGTGAAADALQTVV